MIMDFSDSRPYCSCFLGTRRTGKTCSSCGEELNVHEWTWDSAQTNPAVVLKNENREVLFHPVQSSGTAAVRGCTPFTPGSEYYWEIKVLTPTYGTDLMIGVGTEKVDLLKSEFVFCSLLGLDQESWGYSYKGLIHHDSSSQVYGGPFSQGAIVGVHLDMWRGTLAFYLNRIFLGMIVMLLFFMSRPTTNLCYPHICTNGAKMSVAYNSLQCRKLYPMVCSTACQSAMRLTYSYSSRSSLQLHCLRLIVSDKHWLQRLYKIPGLRAQLNQAYWWLTPELNQLHNVANVCENGINWENSDTSDESLKLVEEDEDDVW
uniref:B30.2/SPRY domain-containing protein n=1 Tax=Timema bartmani TaxID=61472 RepID=A0A7R9F3C4_9NEOP|nr:unnamed protein product [Timema bartmani]